MHKFPVSTRTTNVQAISLRLTILLLGILSLAACGILTSGENRNSTPIAVSAATESRAATLSELPTRTPTATSFTRAALTASPQARAGSSTQTLLPTFTPDPLECLPEPAGWSFGLVKGVQSGDAIWVDIQGRLRSVHYLGLRAPRAIPPAEYGGPAAATQNAALVLGKVVQLVADPAIPTDQTPMERYVLVYGAQVFANYELVRLGLAQAGPTETPFACRAVLLTAQAFARTERAGLWAPTPSPISTITPRPSPTAGPTFTLDLTTSPTPTFTPSDTVTGTPPTATPTETPTGTITITPPTETVSPTPTLTPSPSGTVSSNGSPSPTASSASTSN